MAAGNRRSPLGAFAAGGFSTRQKRREASGKPAPDCLGPSPRAADHAAGRAGNPNYCSTEAVGVRLKYVGKNAELGLEIWGCGAGLAELGLESCGWKCGAGEPGRTKRKNRASQSKTGRTKANQGGARANQSESGRTRANQRASQSEPERARASQSEPKRNRASQSEPKRTRANQEL